MFLAYQKDELEGIKGVIRKRNKEYDEKLLADYNRIMSEPEPQPRSLHETEENANFNALADQLLAEHRWLEACELLEQRTLQQFPKLFPHWMVRKSFVSRGRLRRDPALAGKAEPRRCTVVAELDGAQLDDFKRRFDGERYFPGRPARRTHLPRRTFGRANHAKPDSSGRERRRNLCGKTAALFWFIEDVKASAVEDKTERTAFRSGGQKVQGGEAAR